MRAQPTTTAPTTQHSPGSQSSSSSSSQSHEAQPRACRPQKRRGKRISILREVYAVDQRTTNNISTNIQTAFVSKKAVLSPSSTEVRSLAGLELRAALTHHLIRNAWATLDVLHPPDLSKLDTTAVRHKFSARSLESDAVIAALLAVGAMTSTHSAIVGQVKHIDHPSPDDLVALGLGRRREAAVQVLAARSVAIARESGVLESADADAGEVCSLLAMLALYSARHDPFMMELRDSMQLRRAVQQKSPRSSGRGAMGALVVSDAFVGLVFQKNLTLSDEDLVECGMDDARAVEARERLEAVRSRATGDIGDRVLEDLRRCGVALMRDVVRLQALPLDCALGPLVKQFATLYATVDLILDLLCQVLSPAQLQSFRGPHHLKMPIILESTLTAIASKHAQARTDDPRAEKLLVKAQRRFLDSLARSANALHATSVASEQVTAIVWTALDVFPEWDELAIEGARQSGRGEGPLSGTQWTWTEFARVHTFLKLSTATFASSQAREQRFRRAWEARQEEIVEREKLMVLRRLGGFPVGGGGAKAALIEGDEAVAVRMVNQALVELAA